MGSLLAASEAIERIIKAIALTAGWLFLVCVAVICFDVFSRKLGYQVPNFGSTRLQELEWHLHTGIFALWLGYAYVHNSHVRIDVVSSRAQPRGHAALELLGCLLFAFPYCLVGLYFGVDFAWTAWVRNEASMSAAGLPYRFVAKGIVAAGFLLLNAATAAVFVRSAAYLWGPPNLRERAAFGAARGGLGAGP